MKKSEEIYNIGLDIGTNSVGWAVTDESNNLIKLNNKRDLWGVRLFEEASDASERRLFRSTARRMNRRKERIKTLQDLMKSDFKSAEFFNTLKLSKYYLNDALVINKKEDEKIFRSNKYNLFNDDNFNDKELYKQYNTIYHLRKHLISTTEKVDIRLIYLAIHHIIKYRGNFLYAGEFNLNDSSILVDRLQTICEFLNIKEFKYDETFNILQDTKKNKKLKCEEIISLISLPKESKVKLKAVIYLILGYKENLKTIFELEDDFKIKLTDEYDENEIQKLLGNYFDMFTYIKDLSSWFELQNILKGNTYISEAFIAKYNKYKDDLNKLKSVYKKYMFDKYSIMFKENKKDNKTTVSYAKYDLKSCSLEDLNKVIINDLNSLVDIEDEEITQIRTDIENDEFLVRLNNTSNSSIPYQLNKKELELIIKNQSKYYASLNESDDKGNNKLLQLLSFKIPYYVGPLHCDETQPNNWSIRNEGYEHTKVYPWNFEQVINKEASANIFINRMTNQCMYLPKEKVLPKQSLLYSEYCVINELTNIRYTTLNSTERFVLLPEIRKAVIDSLFKKNKTVTVKRLKDFLKINNINVDEIFGMSDKQKFLSNLETYIDFEKILNVSIDNSNKDMIENIINWITVFEDKDILKSKVINEYSDVLSNEQIEDICKKKYSGWGRLSKKLLCDTIYVNEYNNRLNIMDLLRTTNLNFMQIISDDEFGFNKVIKEATPKINFETLNLSFYNDNIKDIPTSPKNKRGIWQSLKLVDEIVNIMGRKPNNIYIEFARSDEESSTTNTRLNRLTKLYDDFYKEFSEEENIQIRKSLKSIKGNVSERLYLYFLQNGKCMYSGNSLDIDNLELYEIDHIIPQSKIKDDSFDNKVLVLKEYNQAKTDGYISDKIIGNMRMFWEKLYKCNLISNVKYFNLINNKETDKRLEGFVKKQLVETRQITKYVQNILNNMYTDCNVVSVKATLTHNFREKYDIYKIREINNYHHAHDAYITAFVGSYISDRYPKFFKDIKYIEYFKNLSRTYEGKYGFIIDNIAYSDYYSETKDSTIDKNDTLKQIIILKDYIDNKQNIYVTLKTEELTGQFYNQGIKSKEEAKKSSNPICLKENLDPLKYGSYDSVKTAYVTLISYVEKDRIKLKSIRIPVQYSLNINNDNQLYNYISLNNPDLENIKIIIPKILKNTTVKIDNNFYFIKSSSELSINRELKLDKDITVALYYILNYNAIKTDKVIKIFQRFNNILSEITQKSDYLYNYIKSSNHSDEERKLFKAHNMDVRDYMLDKLSELVFDAIADKIQKLYFPKIGEKILSNKDIFIALDKEAKIKVIKQMLIICKGKRGELEDIKSGSAQGRLTGQNFAKFENIIISKSITGIYESRVNLNELSNSNNNKQG